MTVHISDPSQAPKGCVIWMHGLGADSGDMMGLAKELDISIPLRHVFIDAPIRPVTLNNGMSMRAWYDIHGLTLSDLEDREGIRQSETMIRQVIEQQMADGFSSETIMLAGFSQGGAMALYTGLQTTIPLAGIISLSGYLLLAEEVHFRLNPHTPLFLAMGEFDPIVQPSWTKLSVTRLQQVGYDQLTCHQYPMEHSVCADEVNDLGKWITSVLSKVESKGVA